MKKNKSLLFVAVSLIAIGLIGMSVLFYFSNSRTLSTRSFSSLGEQIYNTGRGEDGKLISFSSGPHWMSMHGGSCASCHGKKGKGDIRVDMTDEIAPAITWDALVKGEHEHKDEEKNHKDEHQPYNEETVKKAIIEGKNPSGDSLNSAMPRWKMNDKEVKEVIKFLKTLD
ncbi:MAG: c-type cytochrome [Actinobacteria bacterium]|nr:MAG: c-type cytochrome [Actinomycetota bacterium]